MLQQRELRRVGGTRYVATDARVVSASNRDLEAMVRAGTFREDLWYRLDVVEIRAPALRERREDLPRLIDHFLRLHGGTHPPRLSRAAVAALLDYDWPGNVRELENEIQRAVALADGVIDADSFSAKVRPPTGTLGRAARGSRSAAGDAESLKEAVDRCERQLIIEALEGHGGRVAAAARALGLTRAGLYKKINKHGILIERPTTETADVDPA